MPGFPAAMAIVFRSEGGLADHPNDRGGRTNYGIASETWRLWLEAHSQDQRPIDLITKGEARSIYHRWYWVRGKCDGLPWPLSLVHFDGCVQHGTLSEAKLLQRSLGLVDDGIIGPVTLGAASDGDPARAAEDLIWVRLDESYRRILSRDASQRVFAPAWIHRMAELRRFAVGSEPVPETYDMGD